MLTCIEKGHNTEQTLNFSDQKNKLQQSEAMDPINALQNLTNQGTRNPMPAQMMNMGNQIGMGNVNPNANANVLQNLINVSFIGSSNTFSNTVRQFKCESRNFNIKKTVATASCGARANAADAKYSGCCSECNGQYHSKFDAEFNKSNELQQHEREYGFVY